mmetsp:Transcript_52988/g.84479  ORF Transcript_52988/g.84479 Transcript_52988/m.84479 type:complete len:233 (+) Transcript_52988:46-744(+)
MTDIHSNIIYLSRISRWMRTVLTLHVERMRSSTIRHHRCMRSIHHHILRCHNPKILRICHHFRCHHCIISVHHHRALLHSHHVWMRSCHSIRVLVHHHWLHIHHALIRRRHRLIPIIICKLHGRHSISMPLRLLHSRRHHHRIRRRLSRIIAIIRTHRNRWQVRQILTVLLFPFLLRTFGLARFIALTLLQFNLSAVSTLRFIILPLTLFQHRIRRHHHSILLIADQPRQSE